MRRFLLVLFMALCTISIANAVTYCSDCASCNTATSTPGEYVVLNQSITAVATCVNINADNVTFDCNGETITGPGSGIGVFTDSVNGAIVNNCKIINFGRDLYFMDTIGSSATGNTLLNATINNVEVLRADNLNFSNNVVTDGVLVITAINLMQITDSQNVVIQNNFFGNTTAATFGGLNGIYFTGNSTNGLIYSNTFSNMPCSIASSDYGIYIDASNNTISNNNINNIGTCGTSGGLIISAPNNVVGNNFTSDYYGVYASTAGNSIIHNNNFNGSTTEDIYLLNSPDVLFYHNNIFSGLYPSVYSNVDINLTYLNSGNYWGHSSPPLFMEGADSNAVGVNDTHPYDIADGWSCEYPTDNMSISQNTTFCPGTYNLPNGINFVSSGVTLDCGGASLVGNATSTLNGITILGLGGVDVKNCHVYNYDTGIRLSSASFFNTIENNTVNSNYNGIFVSVYSGYNKIINNILLSNNNTAIVATSHSDYVNISSNIVMNSLYGIEVVNADQSTISENQISAIDTGIFIDTDEYSKTISNNVTSGLNGIEYYFSTSYGLIENNEVSNTDNGLLIYGASYSDYIANYIHNNSVGISMAGSGANHFLGNIIDSNNRGIWANNAVGGNLFQTNQITNCNDSGIVFEDHAYNNVLTNNHFVSNQNYDVVSLENTTWILPGINTNITHFNSRINASSDGYIETDYYLDTGIASANITANPSLNVTANITMTGLSFNSTPFIYYRDGHWTNASDVISGGTVCSPSVCQNIDYNVSTGTLTFTATHFSAFAPSTPFGCIIPTDGMSITMNTTLCPGSYYLPNGITIGEDDVTLICDGTILNGAGGNGILINSENNEQIIGCNITGYINGILLVNSELDMIAGNTVYSNTFGIRLFGIFSSLNHIENNTVFLNEQGIALETYPYHNTISNNNVYSNDEYGIYISDNSDNNLILNNLVYGSTPIFGPLQEGIIISHSVNNLVVNNTVYKRMEGILLQGSSNNNVVENNTIFNCTNVGFSLGSGSSNNFIEGNTIFGNTRAMFLWAYSSNNLVSNNNMSSSSYYGISIGLNSINNTLSIYNLLHNYFSNNILGDIETYSDGQWNDVGENTTLQFGGSYINATPDGYVETAIYLNQSIVAVNVSLNPTLNISGNIIMNEHFIHPVIYYRDGFWTDPSDIISGGTICPDTLCLNKQYTTDILTFTAAHFGSFAINESPVLVTLNSPLDLNNSVSLSDPITINCSAIGDSLSNITLYMKVNGTFQPYQTQTISGTYGEGIFTVNMSDLIGQGKFIDGPITWNCEAYDNLGLSDVYASNFTFSGWDLGSYDNTTENSEMISLSGNNTHGTYTSKIYDSGDVSQWRNISWIDPARIELGAWYKLESDGLDSVGSNDLTFFTGVPEFVPGYFGNAIHINSSKPTDVYVSLDNFYNVYGDSSRGAFSLIFRSLPAGTPDGYYMVSDKLGQIGPSYEPVYWFYIVVTGGAQEIQANLRPSDNSVLKNSWLHVPISPDTTYGAVMAWDVNGLDNGHTIEIFVGDPASMPTSPTDYGTDDLGAPAIDWTHPSPSDPYPYFVVGGEASFTADMSDSWISNYKLWKANAQIRENDLLDIVSHMADQNYTGPTFIERNLNVSVRVCNMSDCSDKNFTSLTNLGNYSDIYQNGRYFQYQFNFEGLGIDRPNLKEAIVEYGPVPTCTTPIDGMNISTDTLLCSGTYSLPNGINIVADNVVLTCNGTILVGSNDRGIMAYGHSDDTITGCTFTNYHTSIDLQNGFGFNVSYNTILNSSYGSFNKGISLDNVGNSFISHNNITDMFDSYQYISWGIYLIYSNNNIFTDNSIQNTYSDIYARVNGVQANYYCTGNSYINNSIDNMGHGFEIDISDNTILLDNTVTNIRYAAINISESVNVTVSNNYISNANSYGIEFYYTTNGVMNGNQVYNCSSGAHLLFADLSVIENNVFNLNDRGIYLDSYYTNSWIINNTVNFNRIGIDIESESTRDVIVNNTLYSNSEAGLYTYNIGDDIFSNNNISLSQYGVEIAPLASNLQLSYNNFQSISDGAVICSPYASWNLVGVNTTITHYGSTINASSDGYIETDYYLNQGIASANITANPSLNVTANITMTGLSFNSTPFIAYREGHWTDPADVINGGTVCPPSICQNINYDVPSGNLTFTVTQFSAFAPFIPGNCTIPTDGMNISDSTFFCPGTYLVPHGVNIVNDSITLECNNANLYSDLLSGMPSGILLNGRTDVLIRDCNLSYYYHGIYLLNSSNNFITNNYGTNNSDFVHLFSADGNLISGNDFTGNWKGLYIDYNASNNTIENNVANGFIGDVVIYVNNYLSSHPVAGSNNNIIRNNHLYGGDTGIELSVGAGDGPIIGTKIYGNNMEHIGIGSYYISGTAILVQGASETTIYGNTLENNHRGVLFYGGYYLGDQNNNNITGNQIINNSEEGITIGDGSFNSLILNNNLSSNNIGVRLSGITYYGSENTTIANNTIDNSTQHGISFDSSPKAVNNVVSKNLFRNSTLGDVFSDSQSSWKFIGNQVTLTHYNSTVNASSNGYIETDYYTNVGIVSANTAANHGLNVTANVTMYNVDYAGAIYYSSGFWTTPADVKSHGIPCPGSICSNVNYNPVTRTLTFTAAHFSSFAVSPLVPPLVTQLLPNDVVRTSYATLKIQTDTSTICKYSLVQGTSFSAMSNVFTDSDGFIHTAYLIDLNSGLKHYYVACYDSATNLTTNFDATFTVTFKKITPQGTLSTTMISPASILNNGVSGVSGQGTTLYNLLFNPPQPEGNLTRGEVTIQNKTVFSVFMDWLRSIFWWM